MNKTGSVQFDEMYAYLTDNGWTLRFVWLDVESYPPDGYSWPNNITQNRALIQSFVDRAAVSDNCLLYRVIYLQSRAVRVGIYAKYSNWPDIVGNWQGPSAVDDIW
jgi:hypothetical protein